MTEKFWLHYQQEYELSPIFKISRLALGPTRPPTRRVSEALFPGLEWPKREAYHTHTHTPLYSEGFTVMLKDRAFVS